MVDISKFNEFLLTNIGCAEFTVRAINLLLKVIQPDQELRYTIEGGAHLFPMVGDNLDSDSEGGDDQGSPSFTVHNQSSPPQIPVVHNQSSPPQTPVVHNQSSPTQIPVVHNQSSPTQIPVVHNQSSPTQIPVVHNQSSPTQIPVVHNQSSPTQIPVIHNQGSPPQMPVAPQDLQQEPLMPHQQQLEQLPLMPHQQQLEQLPLMPHQQQLEQLPQQPEQLPQQIAVAVPVVRPRSERRASIEARAWITNVINSGGVGPARRPRRGRGRVLFGGLDNEDLQEVAQIHVDELDNEDLQEVAQIHVDEQEIQHDNVVAQEIHVDEQEIQNDHVVAQEIHVDEQEIQHGHVVAQEIHVDEQEIQHDDIIPPEIHGNEDIDLQETHVNDDQVGGYGESPGSIDDQQEMQHDIDRQEIPVDDNVSASGLPLFIAPECVSKIEKELEETKEKLEEAKGPLFRLFLSRAYSQCSLLQAILEGLPTKHEPMDISKLEELCVDNMLKKWGFQQVDWPLFDAVQRKLLDQCMGEFVSLVESDRKLHLTVSVNKADSRAFGLQSYDNWQILVTKYEGLIKEKQHQLMEHSRLG